MPIQTPAAKSPRIYLYHSPRSSKWTLICHDHAGRYRRRRVRSLLAAREIFTSWMVELSQQAGESVPISTRFPVERTAEAELHALEGSEQPAGTPGSKAAAWRADSRSAEAKTSRATPLRRGPEA
jgi:hypothetical protein